MKIYLIRHAWAEERDEQLYPDDRLRPLKKGAQIRFKKQLTALGANAWPIAAIFTSPLTRCWQTAEVLCDTVKTKVSIEPTEELAPGSNWAAVLKASLDRGVKEVAWVGHGPDIDEGFAFLLGSKDVKTKMHKGAIALFEIKGENAAHLVWYMDAKALGFVET